MTSLNFWKVKCGGTWFLLRSRLTYWLVTSQVRIHIKDNAACVTVYCTCCNYIKLGFYSSLKASVVLMNWLLVKMLFMMWVNITQHVRCYACVWVTFSLCKDFLVRDNESLEVKPWKPVFLNSGLMLEKALWERIASVNCSGMTVYAGVRLLRFPE